MSDDATRTSPLTPAVNADMPSTGSIALPTKGDVPTRSSPLWPSIPGYDILEQIGQGGMGVVFRAREIAFDRDVAIKLLQDHFPIESPSARRFVDEARITAQLQHPAIPPVHHIGKTPDGRPFLVMKLIKGDTLSELLAADSTDRGRFVVIFAQLCHAIAYAHARKVIHRDLKPANIMVGAFGEVQVMDWGLAKLLSPGQSARREETLENERTVIRTIRDVDSATQTGSVLGTPAFMSPEQAGGEVAKVDERSDVFGLGAMLCAIVTGKPPYVAANSDDVRLMAIRGETADAISRLDRSGADPELVAICKRCLSPDRESRPVNADEVAKAVTAHLSAAEERARTAELSRVRTEEKTKRRRVQTILIASLFGMILIAGFAVVVVDLFLRAVKEKDAAVKARDGEAAARTEAIEERSSAEKARDAEKRTRERLERLEYGRLIQLAYQGWRDGDVGEARILLDRTRPEWRGWEWRYLHRLCHSHLQSFTHSRGLGSAAFNRDGTKIVTACSDKIARIWDIRTGEVICTLQGHSHFVWTARFSPDDSLVVTASYDRTAKIWNAQTGELLRTLTGHDLELSSAEFSPDGTKIVTGSYDLTARIWDAATAKELHKLNHNGPVFSVAFNANGTRIATACADATAKIWEADDGTFVRALEGHKGHVNSVAFNRSADDAEQIVTAGEDKTVVIWNAKTGKQTQIIKGHAAPAVSASFNADGSQVVTSSRDYMAKVWSASTGAQLFELKGHDGMVFSSAFCLAPGMRHRIVTASWDETARIWQTDSAVEPRVFPIHEGIDGAPDITSWASLSPDETSAVTVGSDNDAEVKDVRSGTARVVLRGHLDLIDLASWSADSSRIVTTSQDKTAKVWESSSGDHVCTLKGTSMLFQAAEFSPDGQRIVTGTIETEPAKVWDANTGAELLSLNGHSGSVTSVAWSLDGRLIATGGGNKAKSRRTLGEPGDYAVRVWDAKSGQVVSVCLGHLHEVSCLKFNRDGSRLVSGCREGKIRIWDTSTGKELQLLRAHLLTVNSVALSPDDSRIVSASVDRTIRIWDAHDGTELLALKGHTTFNVWARFSPDGSKIVSTSADGVRIWDARPVNWEFFQPERAPAPRVVSDNPN